MVLFVLKFQKSDFSAFSVYYNGDTIYLQINNTEFGLHSMNLNILIIRPQFMNWRIRFQKAKFGKNLICTVQPFWPGILKDKNYAISHASNFQNLNVNACPKLLYYWSGFAVTLIDLKLSKLNPTEFQNHRFKFANKDA